MKFSRRNTIVLAAIVIIGGCFAQLAFSGSWFGDDEKPVAKASPSDIAKAREVIKSGSQLQSIDDAVWRAMLDEKSYNILWEKGTERAFTGDLLKENREGVFVSKGCRIPVFKSDHKFKSGTGWPSFWDVFDKDNVVLKEDRSWGMRRIEILSACGEHLGHVFEDGPEPTGMRYCINSAALAFIPKGQADPLGPLAEKP